MYTSQLPDLLLQAVAQAHAQIIEGKLDLAGVGTTTLLGGVLIRVQQQQALDFSHAFVYASVGDCKGYLWSREHRTLSEMADPRAADPRANARDPGGRIGPHTGDLPDLRNICCELCPCERGDIIFLVTDGVHDNFDPQSLGITPAECHCVPARLDASSNSATADHPDVDTSQTWEEFTRADPSRAAAAKRAFAEEHMRHVLLAPLGEPPSRDAAVCPLCGAVEASIPADGDNVPELLPEHVAEALLEHCHVATRWQRVWMQQNPKSKVPHDYQRFPGKLDHTTCVAWLVGE
eukprot:TRINITY_DN2013_c0_g1_i2.p1 TRINITY_DN2013_c0_g1~~TRINITY_DN2013_c0_g1_i2.p1  ORF type:complete len:292 (-),score=61.26 TRINITY_DN2013_c0_g1_i2:34-909(-)